MRKIDPKERKVPKTIAVHPKLWASVERASKAAKQTTSQWLANLIDERLAK